MLRSVRKRVPWFLLYEAARLAHGHLMEVTSPDDRARLTAIVRSTHGNPRRLTDSDKAELKRIGGKLELISFVRSAAPRLVIGRRFKR